MNPALLGSGLGALAVVLGAFGAHALKDSLAPDRLAIFEVGVRYQMYHALALLLTGVLLRGSSSPATWPTQLFFWGTVVFSGSLYALAFGAPKMLGAVTPLGGLALIGGWVALFLAARSA
jgi:uncharacterized membrane protein YgdD (TMEM256/DUF423 family)